MPAAAGPSLLTEARVVRCALAAAIACALTLAAAGPTHGAPAEPGRAVAESWPVPIPGWFWVWARWYLHRGEFAAQPHRSEMMRPAAAPERIPDWAWRRLRALLGQEAAREREPDRVVRMWPVPLPQWFWVWARWSLGRGEFAALGPEGPDARPPAAPAYVPEWAWRRLAAIRGDSRRGDWSAATCGPSPPRASVVAGSPTGT